MKDKKPKKERPQYNMFQNAWYMIKLAFRVRKSVLVLCILVLFLSVAANLAELYVTPVILQKVETAAPVSELLLTILFFVGVMMVMYGLLSYVQTQTMFGRTSLRTHLTCEINYKISTTSYPNTEDEAVLKKMDRAGMATCGNSQATEAVWDSLTNLLKNVVWLGIFIGLLAYVDWVLILVTVVTTVIGYFVNKYIYAWGYRNRDEESEYTKTLNFLRDRAEDTTLAKDIRIFGLRPWLEELYEKTLRLHQAFVTRGEKVYIWANVLDVVLSFLRNGVAYFYLIGMALEQGLPASEFLLLFNAVGGFTNRISWVFHELAQWHTHSLEISVVREFLEMPEPFRFEGGKTPERPENGEYEIELRNVSFRYPKAEQDILHGINLTIRPGEKLAVVGQNGAGKTTLVKLICGFYDPTEGAVLLNGTDIREFNRREYYALFSAVFQQFSVLDVTLAENVAQQPKDIDVDRVKACVEKAGLTGKVESLPQDYETHIGRRVYEDGVELSGGETQRLMLARALYKGAPLLILDEPTAALDPIAENEIYLKYNEMTAGCTSVYISHRLASTRFCDRIILIADGKISEEGTHDSLMENGGLYTEMFEVQSKYYKEESKQAQSLQCEGKVQLL